MTNAYCKSLFRALGCVIMKKTIIGNWKMNGTRQGAVALAREVARFAAEVRTPHEVVLCPPAHLLDCVGKALQATVVGLGAQDCSAHSGGAFTGEISAGMLADVGCGYVIVGHSERRAYHFETNALVKAKAEAALAAGLVPIICVGETLEEREAGRAEAVVSAQIFASLPSNEYQLPPTQPSPQRGEGYLAHFLLAYEPVWAIGSGKIPSNDDIAAMHAHILRECPQAKVLYGGSVKAANAAEIMAIAGVSGVLVGGASLKAEEFCGIIEGGI